MTLDLEGQVFLLVHESCANNHKCTLYESSIPQLILMSRVRKYGKSCKQGSGFTSHGKLGACISN